MQSNTRIRALQTYVFLLVLSCVQSQFPGLFPMNMGNGFFPGTNPQQVSIPSTISTRPVTSGSINAVVQPRVDRVSTSPQQSTFSDIAASLGSPGLITGHSLGNLLANLPSTLQYGSIFQGYQVILQVAEGASRKALFKSSISPSMSVGDGIDGEYLHVSLIVPSEDSGSAPDNNCCMSSDQYYRVKRVFNTPQGSVTVPSIGNNVAMNRVAAGTYAATVQLGHGSNIKDITLVPKVVLEADGLVHSASVPIIMNMRADKTVDILSDQTDYLGANRVFETANVDPYYSPGQTTTVSIAPQDTGAVQVRQDHAEWPWCDVVWRVGRGTRFVENSASQVGDGGMQEAVSFSQLSRAQRSSTLKVSESSFLIPSLPWRSNSSVAEEQQQQPVCGDTHKSKRGRVSVYHPEPLPTDEISKAVVGKMFKIVDGVLGVLRPSGRQPVIAYIPGPVYISAPVGYVQDVWSVTYDDSFKLDGLDVGMAVQAQVTSALRRVLVRYSQRTGTPVEIEQKKDNYKFSSDALSLPSEPVHLRFEIEFANGSETLSRRVTVEPQQQQQREQPHNALPVVPSRECLQCVSGCNPLEAIASTTGNPTLECWGGCCEAWELHAFPKLLGSVVMQNPELSRQQTPSALSSKKFVETMKQQDRKQRYSTFQLQSNLESWLDKAGNAVTGQVNGVKGGAQQAKTQEKQSRAAAMTNKGVRSDSKGVTELVTLQQDSSELSDAPQEKLQRVVTQSVFVDVAGVEEFKDKAVVDLVVPEMQTPSQASRYGTGLFGKTNELVDTLFSPQKEQSPFTPRTQTKGLANYLRKNACLNTGCYASCLGGLEQGITSIQTTANMLGMMAPPIQAFKQPGVPYMTPEYVKAVGVDGVASLLSQSSGLPMLTPQMLQAMSPMLLDQGKRTASNLADITNSITSTSDCVNACKISCEAGTSNKQQCIDLQQCFGSGIDSMVSTFDKDMVDEWLITEQMAYDKFAIFGSKSNNASKVMKTSSILDDIAGLFKGITAAEAVQTIKLGANTIGSAVSYVSDEANQAKAIIQEEQRQKQEQQVLEQQQKEKDEQFKKESVRAEAVEKLSSIDTLGDQFKLQGTNEQAVTAAAGVQDLAFVLNNVYSSVETTDEIQAAKKSAFTTDEVNIVVDRLSTEVDTPGNKTKIFAPGSNLMHALTLIQSIERN